jgi:hypothetical protein
MKLIIQMDMLRIAFIIILPILIVLPANSQKNTDGRGIERENGTYANLFRFEFKPGKTDEGLVIFKNTLMPAFKNAGVKVTLLEDLMGTKDLLALIELKDGPSFYEYSVPRQDLVLFEELIKLAGSEQEAEVQLDRFVNLLVRQSQTLVFVHSP